MEDRVGQVWASKYYDEVDFSKATIFVISSRHADWKNPHTGRVIASWAGHVLFSERDTPGRMYVWEEDNYDSGGDSYDNAYERIT